MQTQIVPRRKILSKWWLFFIFLFLLLVLIASSVTYAVKSSIAAPSTDSTEKVFVIKEGESMVEIAQKLKEAGLIKDVNAFRLYARFACEGVSLSNPTTLIKKYPIEKCLAGNIQAGSFELSPNMDLSTLAKKLTTGRLDSWTTIKEGWRNEEIAAELAKNYGIKEEDFLKVAQIGYMFPDTYLFKTTSNADEIAAKLRATFEQKFTSELQEKAKAQGLTLDEVVILASIIERETGKDPTERATVAGILLNRVNSGWRLEADATVQFALGYDQDGKVWWKKSLFAEDLEIDSPYNTRRYGGLPPGPISNPGLSALKAVAEPIESDYYFYLHEPNGTIHYGKTLAEHNANKAKYLQ